MLSAVCMLTDEARVLLRLVTTGPPCITFSFSPTFCSGPSRTLSAAICLYLCTLRVHAACARVILTLSYCVWQEVLLSVNNPSDTTHGVSGEQKPFGTETVAGRHQISLGLLAALSPINQWPVCSTRRCILGSQRRAWGRRGSPSELGATGLLKRPVE